jgi:hypothetical protein
VERLILQDIFAFAAGITALGCLTGVIVTYIKYRARRFLPTPALMARLDEIAERLSRLENSVDSTAVEVERISEAQRFTAKVLAERSGAPAAIGDRPRGSTTPH